MIFIKNEGDLAKQMRQADSLIGVSQSKFADNRLKERKNSSSIYQNAPTAGVVSTRASKTWMHES